jgi:hypothetical protein
LRFRHFLRLPYVVNLDPAKLVTTRDRLARAVAQTEPWIEAVLSGLTSVD